MIVKYGKWIIVVVILASFAMFIYNSDIQGIGVNLNQVGLNFFYLIFVTFLAQIFGTLSWKSTLPQSLDISFKDLFLIRYVGEHIGLINPANFVGGDAFKAYQFEKRGIDYKVGISSLVVARMVMIYIQVVVYLVAAFIYLFYCQNELSLLVKSMIIALSFIMVSALIVYASNRFFQSKFFQRRGIGDRIQEVRSTIRFYYKNQKERLSMSILWAVINFLIGAIEIWLICYFIGAEVTYLEALLIDQGSLFFKSFAAFIPGQLGVEEYTNKLMLTIVGISSVSVWISVSILRRARQMFWLLLGALTYYFFLSKDEQDLIVNEYSFKT